MISWTAVFEVDPVDDVSWPVATAAPWSWVVLDRNTTDEESGLFIARLASIGGATGSLAEVIDALIAEEVLLINGGVRLTDEATAQVVVPGCCAGLENWRDWAELMAGQSVWLGHSPDPEIEFFGEDLRVWQDGKNRQAYVDLPRAALPGLLADVRRDLVGFLDALGGWGQRAGLGGRTSALVEALDDSFRITAAV
ncbi:hypothetical protein [Actinoplanes solisilvae]|uniref:hypothetical protein n=1 Tax=Actinoplanes solisilvae TaxID=2486853 RepID=UPI001F0C2442|nr:hypothetical protein [Actinoplanes solisilvae]